MNISVQKRIGQNTAGAREFLPVTKVFELVRIILFISMHIIKFDFVPKWEAYQ